MEIRDEELKEIFNEDIEDEYEKYCFVCRRPEHKAGKMITMMEGMHICPDCMQKTMDAVSASPLKLDKYTENSDDLEMPKGPNISMINLADLQSFMSPRKKVKKKKGDKKPAIELKDIPAPHKIKAQLDEYVIGQEHAKKAIAVAVTGIEKDGTALAYNDGENNIPFQYSAEITNKSGVATYVALVDATFDEKILADSTKRENFKTDGNANTITFGDTNSDKTVNAQDALAVVDAWLRKTAAPNDSQILRMNVNGDDRINTFDALGIVEAFTNQSNSEYLVVLAAASMSNTK